MAFVDADYPEEAKKQGTEGRVLLEILVDENGRTTDVKVLAGAGYGFDEAAIAAARKFAWRPGRAGEKSVPVRVTYEYQFTLKPEVSRAIPPPAPSGGPNAIHGVVLERGTRQPLPGVRVSAIPKGQPDATKESVTDDNGRFSLEELTSGILDVVLLYPAYKRGVFSESLSDNRALEVRYFLERITYDRYQTIVQGASLREEIERRVVSIEEATKIPGTRGDALRAVESMPGVARPPLGAGLLVVRGSNPEDTTALISGHWVPLIYHFGGITSVVNSDLLERIDYLPGNFSARYGRAIGGVVSADFRAPRTDRLAGYARADLIDAGFLLEGPLGAGSFALSARRSYVDAILSAVLADSAEFDLTVAPRYYDYQALLDYPVLGGRLKLHSYGSDDLFEFVFADPSEIDPAFRGTLATSTSFHRLQASFHKALDIKNDLLISMATGIGGLEFSAGTNLGFDIDVWFGSYRFEWTHKPWRGLRLRLGIDGQTFPFSLAVQGPRPYQEGEFPSPPSLDDQLATDRDDLESWNAIYAEAEISLGRGLTLTPGSRIEYYLTTHQTVVDPRLSLRWDRGPNTLRFGFGRYSEQPQAWESDPVYGNPEIRAEHALHLSFGYDRHISPPLRIETTVFYKWLNDLIVRDDGLSAGAHGELEEVAYSNAGIGRIYGAELLVRHNLTKRFFGWLSYTLSRSERRDHPDEPYRLFSLDQTHILTLVASARLPWRSEVGVRFRFVSGNPQIPVIGSVYDADADTYWPIPGAINSERMEPFHQLDVRIDKRFVFEGWMMTAYLDVQNAYNRLNPEAYFYSYDYRDRTTIHGLPIIPSIGIKGEF